MTTKSDELKFYLFLQNTLSEIWSLLRQLKGTSILTLKNTLKSNIHTYICTCIHIHTYIHIRSYIHIFAHILLYSSTHVYTHMHIYAHKHIHTSSHLLICFALMHTHSPLSKKRQLFGCKT